MQTLNNEAKANQTKKYSLIDTDIHERVMYADLFPYLEQPWRRYIEDCNWQQEKRMPFTQPAVAGVDRADAKTPDGKPAGTSLPFMQEQLLDANNHEFGILTGALDPSPSSMHGWYEMATALATAYNDWQINEWLDKESRLYGSVHIAAQEVANAVKEIERVGSHPKMIQVLLPIDDIAWGDPYYHPIFEAAERHDLMIGMHHNEPPAPLGKWPRYFIEWHSLIATSHMAQITSMIFNGVFEKYPNLKLMMIEGGFTYVPFLMKKLDQQFKDLRHEVPWVTTMPSDTIKNRMAFTTQPLEEMSRKEWNLLVEQMGTDEIICFSTDYPHWDYDSPDEAMPKGLEDDVLERIYGENARKFYPKLPARGDT